MERDGIAWADIPNWKGLYQVNTLGQVYSIRTRRLLKSRDNGEGYLFVTLWKNNCSTKYYIHQLVVISFLGPHTDPQFIEVQHKNGKRGDNRLVNLEWTTRRLNNLDIVARRKERTEKLPF